MADKKKIIYVSQEIMPYLTATDNAKFGRSLPQAMQQKKYEVRTFMPDFGDVNERRNQLHEVIRLSGIGITISDNDHPLVVKVASMHPSRIQVYFIDNDDYFQKLDSDADAFGWDRPDNDERLIFFAHGTMETARKLQWDPDFATCFRMDVRPGALYMRRINNDSPAFRKARVVYTIFPGKGPENFSPEIFNKLKADGLKPVDFKKLKDLEPDALLAHKIAILYSDVVWCSMEWSLIRRSGSSPSPTEWKWWRLTAALITQTITTRFITPCRNEIHKPCRLAPEGGLGALCLAAYLPLTSCKDDVSSIGGSLTSGEVTIVMDSIYTDIQAKPVLSESIDGRSLTKLVGRINVPEYGRLECAFVTQMMSATKMPVPDSITEQHVDSMRLVLSVPRGSLTGDSLAPQQLSVYRLTKQLPSGIQSDFDPAGYYDPSSPWAKRSYTLSVIARGDSAVQKQAYVKIPMMLPKDFALDIFRKYRAEDKIFQWPSSFNKFFPGIYVEQNFGNGCVANVSKAEIFLYWNRKVRSYEPTDEKR